jgi:SAM-dependent methyltransferase
MTAESGEPTPDVDALAARLREKVEERRKSGEYPPDLEYDLDQHYQRLVGRGTELGHLAGLLADVKETAEFGRHRIITDSNLPLGSTAHKAIGKVTGRQTEGILDQVRQFADSVLGLLTTLVESRPEHEIVLPDLNARIDTIMERLAELERYPGEGEPALRAVAARIDRIDTRLHREDRPPASFGGTREKLGDEYQALVAELQGCAPVLDVGCGRGEMLQLLAQAGIDARGVDADPVLVGDLKQRGLEASDADPLAYLTSLPDASIGGLFAGNLLEMLSAQELVDLVRTAGHKIRAGGRFVGTAPNPSSIYQLAHPSSLDSHLRRPVHSEYLAFLLSEAGFSDTKTVSGGPVGKDVQLEHLPAGSASDPKAVDALNRNIDRLNQLLFADQTYAVIATR